ncbi:phosphorothioated DNA-binding restriction endonuclease [Saccharothrix sp. ST-888]|uniref:phosphorothioated DNA-binding restriction endonuclease n=1 Tax=Saccharothrix sp. ST-888 TaxID=1427391 RepID=UPI00061FC17C|nr:HNH endonuclease [Saccharothrix sp. ST-888]KJK55073.1 hypothetical protein UK12_30960 [Saccharothrix sp. ST-888]
MQRHDLLNALGALRQAPTDSRRAPHKPLLLLWLLGRFAATGSTLVTYAEAEEPVSRLINDYGPPVSARTAAQRAVQPFVRLERGLWELHSADGIPLGPDTRPEGGHLRRLGAFGRLRPEVETLLRDPATFAAAVFLLLDRNFTGTLEAAICHRTGLDLPTVELSALEAPQAPEAPEAPTSPEADTAAAAAEPETPAAEVRYRMTRRRVRAPGFSEAVLDAYGHACAMCGYDGVLGLSPVGTEAAHVRWHSQGGPDRIDNALALCALHHTLFDYGALGITPDHTIRVSPRFTYDSKAGHRAVAALHDAPVARPRASRPRVRPDFLHWHDREVFKH